MKYLIGFTLVALFLNVFAAGMAIVNLILDPSLKWGLLLALDGFFVILMYNQYKRLTSVPVINPGDRNVS
jgi:predicted branched-subunit amino acid permease